MMKLVPCGLRAFVLPLLLSSVAFVPAKLQAQSCQTSSELEDAARSAVTAAGQRYFDMTGKADIAGLRQNAIPSLASDFAGIEGTVKDHQQELNGSQGAIKSLFLLDATGPAPVPHAEFYCGVFGKSGQTATSAAFYLDNLSPAKYAIVLIDASSAAGRTMVSEVLQQIGTDWKLGGLYIKAAQVAGHDSAWFSERAREYKSKGQLHNAWFYYEQARSLVSALSFMSTLATDKLYDESQSLEPKDLPSGGKTVDLAAGATTYKLTSVFPQTVGNDLDLIVKYQSADATNTTQSYQDNTAVMKAFVTKFPEVRDAFAGMVGRGVDPSGRDYGTLLAMKDIK
jgi:hypothetical protein